MPAARYFPEKESTQWPRPPSLAPSGQFTLSSPGDTPGPPPFNLDDPSTARRGQGVRYALLAPLPLHSRRAEISALTVQAPGLCGPCGQLPQLVGTRRASETAQSHQVYFARGPKARRRGGGHPDMRAGLDHKSSGMRSPVMGSGGHGLADLGGAQRNRSPLGRVPRRSFGFFPIVWKEPRPAGRNSPPAAARRKKPRGKFQFTGQPDQPKV